MLAEAIKAGDAIIEKIVLRAAGLIGRAVGDVVNLLAPDIVVLGGGLVEAMPDMIVKGSKKQPANGPRLRSPRSSRSSPPAWGTTPSSAARLPGPKKRLPKKARSNFASSLP